MNDNDQAVNYFLEIEKETRRLYNFIVDSYKLQKPRGVVLSKKVQQDYNTYLREIENIQSTAFANENDLINSLFNEYESRLNAEISRRKRLEIAIEETISQYKKSTRKEVVEIQDIAKKVSTEVVSLSKDLIKDYEQTVKKIQNELAHIEPYQLDDNKLVEERDRMENALISEAEDIRKVIEGVRTQLENIVYSKDISQVDMVEAYAEEVENLREQLDADLELSQLGLAVSAIQHEFQHTVKVIRNQIRRLKAWADLNEGLDDIYKNFSTNFEHLDNYLTLFSPLDRRLYKKKVNIYGNDSYEFVKSVFYARISEERHNISLEATTSFSKNTFLGYPSTFYPVFVNIVDNAIFWLKDQQEPRKIVLDADKEGYMYISNNGPEIDMRDKERIFELGFTRKPSGKGMGLHISKQVLNKAGYDIITDIPRLGQGVTFKIYKIKDSENA
jgi:signal transduction histidine kinase